MYQYSQNLYRASKGDLILMEGFEMKQILENHRQNNFFLTVDKEKIHYGDVDEIRCFDSNTGESHIKYLRYRNFNRH